MSEPNEFAGLLILGAVVAAGYFGYQYFTAPKVPTLEHQTMCSQAAARYAKDNAVATYSNHFSEEYGRCFVEATSFFNGYVNADIVDPLENTMYAHIDTEPMLGDPKKLMSCYSKLPDRQNENCDSQKQFVERIKPLIGSASINIGE